MSSERIEQLRQVTFCAHLPASALAELAAISVPLQRPAGTLLQLEGEPAEQMYIVVQGRVKIVRVGTNGREQVLNVVGPGEHFNTVPMFDGGPCPANAETLTPVLLLALPRLPLRAAAERHGAIALALLSEFSGRLRHLVHLVDELALHTVQGRLAGLLLEQAVNRPGQPLTQAEMAAQIGTVREMIGRALKTFEGLGLIRIDRGTIVLVDRDGLRAQREA